NSLLEAAAFGERAGRAAAQLETITSFSADVPPHPTRPSFADTQTLRMAMTLNAGVVRDAKGLTTVLELIDKMLKRYPRALMAVSARLVAQCALQRTESRGSHYRTDYPDTLPDAKRTFVRWSDL